MIQAVYDPFFLPPPFIPSHPHLRELCGGAVGFLQGSHARLEQEVKNYIAAKSKEMRDLEEKVRSEVEMLWEKYRDGPGRGDETERRRSASSSRSKERQPKSPEPIRSKTFSPPKEMTPILVEADTTPVNPGSSLLSASLSAIAFYAPASRQIPDAVDDSIEELSKTFNKRSDARAVAMSYVFSNMDEAMSSSQRRGGKEGMTRQELNGKDSWIDGERILLAAGAAVDEGGDDGRTPRQRTLKELPTMDGKGKERAVKFQESTKPREDTVAENVQETEPTDDDKDGEPASLA